MNNVHVFNVKNAKPFHCNICHLAKQRRLPFISNNRFSDSPFDLIHIDTWNPFHTTSVEGYRYFLTIVDNYLCYTWISLLKIKSEVHAIIPTFFLVWLRLSIVVLSKVYILVMRRNSILLNFIKLMVSFTITHLLKGPN